MEAWHFPGLQFGGSPTGEKKHVPCRTAQALEGCRFIELHKSGSVCGCPEEGLPVQEWTSRKASSLSLPELLMTVVAKTNPCDPSFSIALKRQSTRSPGRIEKRSEERRVGKECRSRW